MDLQKKLIQRSRLMRNRSSSRHVSHLRNSALVKVPKLLHFSRRCRICQQSVGVDRVGLRNVLMEDRVKRWDPLYALMLQVFLAPCESDMTKHILMIFATLHEVRSDYALIWVCGRTIAVMLLRLRTGIVLVFPLTTLEEHG